MFWRIVLCCILCFVFSVATAFACPPVMPINPGDEPVIEQQASPVCGQVQYAAPEQGMVFYSMPAPVSYAVHYATAPVYFAAAPSCSSAHSFSSRSVQRSGPRFGFVDRILDRRAARIADRQAARASRSGTTVIVERHSTHHRHH